MISDDSPLKKLPDALDPKQTLFLDGIRHAAEFAHFAYQRLKDRLTELALRSREGHSGGNFTEPFLDAWSVVDAIDRLRSLVKLAPGFDHTSASFSSQFLAQTQSIRLLRNVADHIAQRADQIVARKGTALGMLSWVTVKSEEHFMSCTIRPGTLRTSRTPVINPIEKSIVLPTGLVTLSAGEHSADLTEAMDWAYRMIKSIEITLEKWLNENGLSHAPTAADMLAVCEFVHVPSHEPPSA